MHVSPIISPSGEPLFTAGGGQAWKVRTLGGYVVSLEWMPIGRNIRACMCIWPASNVFVTGEGQGIWTITRNCIGEFVGFTANGKCTGGPSEHCFREAREALPLLGKDPNDKSALHELVDVVVTFAPELVMMPATPRDVRKSLEAPAMFEVTATDKTTGRVVSETEV